MARDIQRTAVTGLLVVCVLLALLLGLTAFLSYRAARAAARDVLYSQAVEVATTFSATARVSGALTEDERLRALTEEMATDSIGIAVLDREGQVLAAAGGLEPLEVGANHPPGAEMRRALRLKGQVHRMSRAAEGAYLEYLRPVGARRGRGHWGRRYWRWRMKAQPRRLQPPPRRPQAGGGGRSPDGRPPWAPRWGRRGRLIRLVRVTVDARTADALVDPARLTAGLAGLVSAVLLLIGIAIHRVARRARRAENELQRRRALAALGEMAAVLAHEIRTPLSSIKGNAQLLGEGSPGDERIDSMVREAGRLERLVNGMLDYARPREPKRVTADPDELVVRAAQIVAPRAAAASVDIITDPLREGACVEVDPDQIIQVVVNLIQNGVEASADAERGRGSVVVRVRRRRGGVVISVLDSGSGLRGVAREEMFKPFFSTKTQGTGLGLSVARQIVEQHGGELILEDRKEGGAAIHAVLPIGGHDG